MTPSYFDASIMTRPIRKVLKLKEAIRLEQLPMQIPRSMGAVAATCCTMTLIRAERDGYLVPIRRGKGRIVYYDRANFLRWMGIDPGVTTLAARAAKRKNAA
jgi:hypothetical protein